MSGDAGAVFRPAPRLRDGVSGPQGVPGRADSSG